MSKELFEFQPMVDKGCKLLDKRLGPDWVEKIDLQKLELDRGCACVLGQLALDMTGNPTGYYEAAARHLFWPVEETDELAIEHGFLIPVEENPDNWTPLEECWKQTILSRRAES